MKDSPIKVFTGNAHPELAKRISHHLGIPLGDAEVTRFNDGESYCKINENVRGTDVFLIQPTCPPVNENLMELLLMLDALKRASASRITAVIPYYGYARQDRKTEPRVPISAKLVADLITAAGASRVLVMDLHVGQIQGFFNIPVDHLFAAPVLLDYIREKNIPDLTIVSPDPGGVERARAFAKRLNATLAIVDKRRIKPNEAKVMYIVGDIKGRNPIIVDDMIDTGGSVIKSAEALKREGAKDIYACCTHPVFSKGAIENLANPLLKEIIVTDTIPCDKKEDSPKVTVLSVAALLAEAIKRIHMNASVSSLFV